MKLVFRRLEHGLFVLLEIVHVDLAVGVCIQVMPSYPRDLGGDQSAFSPIAFLDDFEKVEALLVGGAVSPQVVENKQLDAGELVDETGKAVIEAVARARFSNRLDTRG